MNHNMSAHVRTQKAAPTMKNRMTRLLLAGTALLAVFSGMQSADGNGFLPDQMIVSTVPPNGDVNPYGVAFVPQGFQSGTGPLRPGDILVSISITARTCRGRAPPLCVFLQTAQSQLFLLGHLIQADQPGWAFPRRWRCCKKAS
jgi:hypothetical protein